jgi:two-component system, sensor histidine kinase and response regulator
MVIDWDAALEFVDGDSELLRTVVAASLEELPILIQSLEKAIRTKDADVIQRSAHTMKATGRTLCIPQLLEMARSIERVTAGGDLQVATEIFPQLRDFVERLVVELEAKS